MSGRWIAIPVMWLSVCGMLVGLGFALHDGGLVAALAVFCMLILGAATGILAVVSETSKTTTRTRRQVPWQAPEARQSVD